MVPRTVQQVYVIDDQYMNTDEWSFRQEYQDSLISVYEELQW